ncbi:MAG: HRDC domain-containing protein [Smithellaceae bacterium]
MNKTWFLVDTQKKLERAIDDFDNSSVLSIDTEYDSFRYFREKLCLIQIKAKTAAYIFDPLDNINLSFLNKYFSDSNIVKILHAADNDIRLLKRDYNFVFENIFDTHRAAYLLGFQQLSLEKMINQFLGVELKKSKKMQRSRWDTRPLADEQLQYGVEDVIHLPALYAEQLAELRKKGLEETARDAFAKIAASLWQEKTIDKRGHTKIASYPFLNQEQKDILKKLYAWRFQRAKDENRAIFMFLPDKTLTDLVQCGDNWRDVLPPEKVRLYEDELEQILTGN